ncbi:hypothetical protein [uncultured Flavobacterium sp.]|uniref:hypothetical protein n=1 Tax=uncultured Flavobacterium sp. TaxID=165435 RepID=UPI00120FD838|nr:hypothetical protein [uncultured Flavobacterium sp.]THD30001.1 MAG: hypothetical protein DI588_17675 [Flavobacterium johnsoniae]
MKIWQSNVKSDDKIIAFYNKTIYKGNPKPDEVEKIVRELTIGKQTSSLFGIPQKLLKEINFEVGKNHIEVLFGLDSIEYLKINDVDKKQEIFDFLRAEIPNSRYEVEKYSKFKAGKKPLFAMAFILILFCWALYLANEIENGNQYEIVGSGRSITTIVLALASIGTVNVILLFGVLFCIALLGFIFKTKRPKVVHKIIVEPRL